MTLEDSDALSWRSVADLVGDYPDAPVALIGAGLNARSLTPGRCDLAPRAFRAVLPRFSTYDVETGAELSKMVHDAGDVALEGVSPADAFVPIRDAMLAQGGRVLTVLIGGNNAVIRPGVHALGPDRVGVLTLDAHFDLRDTDQGLTNGNPIQALLEDGLDGLDGRRISQVGLAPFANTRRAHEKARRAGISVRTARDCRSHGLAAVVAQELERLAELCDAIYVDFDIDVIDRGQWPASPGARPGGVSAQEFFDATRVIAAHPKVKAVDLTEYDPSLEIGDLGSLTVGRWFCELLAGFEAR